MLYLDFQNFKYRSHDTIWGFLMWKFPIHEVSQKLHNFPHFTIKPFLINSLIFKYVGKGYNITAHDVV